MAPKKKAPAVNLLAMAKPQKTLKPPKPPACFKNEELMRFKEVFKQFDFEAIERATTGFKLLMEGKIEEADPIIQKFVVTMYDRSSKCTKVNLRRKQLFTKKDRQLENIPPIQSALHQHTLKAVYQGHHIWGHLLGACPPLPDPASWGWQKIGTEWSSYWTDKTAVAEVCRDLTRCKCKAGCQQRCKCKNKKPKMHRALSLCRKVRIDIGSAAVYECLAKMEGDICLARVSASIPTSVKISYVATMLRFIGLNPKGAEMAEIFKKFLEDDLVEDIELHTWYFIIEAKKNMPDDCEHDVELAMAFLGKDNEDKPTGIIKMDLLQEELMKWGEPLTDVEFADWPKVAQKDKTYSFETNDFQYIKFIENMNAKDIKFTPEPVNFFKLDQKQLAAMAMEKQAIEKEERKQKAQEKAAREMAKRQRMVDQGLLQPEELAKMALITDYEEPPDAFEILRKGL